MNQIVSQTENHSQQLLGKAHQLDELSNRLAKILNEKNKYKIINIISLYKI